VRAIVFDNITLGDVLAGVSFEVEEGSMAALITSDQEESDGIVRLLLGLEKPDNGAISVLGSNPCADDPVPLRKRIGVLHPSGGLISNLKVAENVLLPLAYHTRLPDGEQDRRVSDALQRVGYGGRLMELPGNLSLYCKRLVGQARAFIMEPDLVVYNAALGGLSEEENRRIISNAVKFHLESPSRTSFFLTSQAETTLLAPLDINLVLEKRTAV